MTAARYPKSLWICVVACGCVGTMDSLHAVKGEAPHSGSCDISVVDTETGGLLAFREVAGTFSVTYTAGGYVPRVDVLAYCNNAKVRDLKAVSPRSVGDID